MLVFPKGLEWVKKRFCSSTKITSDTMAAAKGFVEIRNQTIKVIIDSRALLREDPDSKKLNRKEMRATTRIDSSMLPYELNVAGKVRFMKLEKKMPNVQKNRAVTISMMLETTISAMPTPPSKNARL